MTDNTSPSAAASSSDRRHSTALLVVGALLVAMLGFLVGAFATPGYRTDQWRYGHMYGYDGGFPGGMMGWGPNGGSDDLQRRVARVDAGQVKSISGNTITFSNGGKVKLTPNTYVVVHTLTSK